MKLIAYSLDQLKAPKGLPTVPVRVPITRKMSWLGGRIPIRYIVRASLLWATQNPGDVFDKVKAMRFGDELRRTLENHSWVVQVSEGLWRRAEGAAVRSDSVAVRSWTSGGLLAFLVESVPTEMLGNIEHKCTVVRAPPLPRHLRREAVPTRVLSLPTINQCTVVGATPRPTPQSDAERVGELLRAGQWVVGSNPPA